MLRKWGNKMKFCDWDTPKDLTEFYKLRSYLIENKIDFVETHKFTRYDEAGHLENLECNQIRVEKHGKYLWDAICHTGSYGCEKGLLEIMGNIVDETKDGDSIVGYLTAADVIERIEKRTVTSHD